MTTLQKYVLPFAGVICLLMGCQSTMRSRFPECSLSQAECSALDGFMRDRGFVVAEPPPAIPPCRFVHWAPNDCRYYAHTNANQLTGSLGARIGFYLFINPGGEMSVDDFMIPPSNVEQWAWKVDYNQYVLRNRADITNYWHSIRKAKAPNTASHGTGYARP